MRNYLIGLAFMVISLSCNREQDAWEAFKACEGLNCTAQVLAVKDAFLNDPKGMLDKFTKTYEKGEDHVIGWLYLMRDSVLFNAAFGTTEERFALQQAIADAARPFEKDPEVSEMAISVLSEIENLAIVSELEDVPVEKFPATGTYQYVLPNDGGAGSVLVSQTGPETIKFSLEVVGTAPAYNQGILEGNATLVSINQYDFSSTEFGSPCTLLFEFSENEVTIVTKAGDSAACGFGANVRADGTYEVQRRLDPFLSEADATSWKKLEGHWVSLDDEKAELKVENGMFVALYEENLMENFPYQYFKVCPETCGNSGGLPCLMVMGDDVVCYTIIKNDEKELQLSMVEGHGNTLRYRKK